MTGKRSNRTGSHRFGEPCSQAHTLQNESFFYPGEKKRKSLSGFDSLASYLAAREARKGPRREMGGYENGDSPAAFAGEDGVILGVDGGTTNTVCVCLPAAMPPPESPAAVPVLARAVAGSSNRNSVGGNRRRISPFRGWLVL